MTSPTSQKVIAYNDSFNENGADGILETAEGYRYRLIDGLMMPPYVTPGNYAESRTVETRPSDICFGSFPKSGSTWLSQVLLLLINGGQNPNHGSLREHMIWAESSWPFPIPIERVEAMDSPRIFKSHMPASMAIGGGPLNQPAKYIYIARNPKDVCVSYYHFETGKAWAGNFKCSWDRWFELFLDGQVQRGDWFDHVLGWWNQRDAANVFFLTYESLLLDFDRQVTKLAEYLGIEVNPKLLANVTRLSSFEQMKSNEFSNMHNVEQLEMFYRKGKIGTWQKQFSDDQCRRFDELVEQRLNTAGLSFIEKAPS